MKTLTLPVATNISKILPYFCIFIYPLTVLIGYGNGYAGLLLTPIAGSILAYFDRNLPISNLDLTNTPSNHQITSPQEFTIIKNIMRLYVLVQVSLVIWAIWLYTSQPLVLSERIGLITCLGATVGAIGGSLSHELIHSKQSIDRYLGMALLACYNYTYFKIEHLEGHHRNFATYHDPSTSRLGENIYQFYIRAITGEWKSVYTIESTRLKRLQKSFWTRHNRLLKYALIQLTIWIAIYLLSGGLGLSFFFLQGAIALLHSETASYIQHYGLERPKQSDGKYLKPDRAYSWNSNHVITNWCFLDLGKHADHHVEPNKPYCTLQNWENTPQLPRGYFDMGLMAVIPPLWFSAMNDRVKKQSIINNEELKICR